MLTVGHVGVDEDETKWTTTTIRKVNEELYVDTRSDFAILPRSLYQPQVGKIMWAHKTSMPEEVKQTIM